MSFENTMAIAGSGMRAQGIRLNTTASNLSNAETVAGSEEKAYRGRHPVFSESNYDFANYLNIQFSDSNEKGVGVKVLDIIESPEKPVAEYNPHHPLANQDGMIFRSNVNTIEETVNMMSASQSYEMNLKVMSTANQLAMETLQAIKD